MIVCRPSTGHMHMGVSLTRRMHVILFLWHIREIWKPPDTCIREFPLYACKFYDIFVFPLFPLYKRKIEWQELSKSINSYRKLHKYLHRAS
jgi:hypothetical protein